MKKLLSLVIILAMAISLFPVTAFADAEDVVYTYDFMLGTMNYDSDRDGSNDKYLASAVKYSDTNDLWEYFAKNTGTDYQYSTLDYVQIKSTVGEYWAVKIQVKEDGIYDIKLKHYQHREEKIGALANVYLLPGTTDKDGIATLLENGDGKLPNAIEFFTTGSIKETESTLAESFKIYEGEYVLVFHAKAASDGTTVSETTAQMFPGFLTLTKTGEIDTTDYADFTFSYDLNPTDDTNISIVDEIDYADTKGMLEWGDCSGDCSVVTHNWGIEIKANAVGQWVAFKINIPVAGIYKASLTHGQSKSMGGYGNVYLLPGNTADISAMLSSTTLIGEDVAFVNVSSNIESTPTAFEKKVVADSAGEYLLVFEASKIGNGTFPSYRMYPNTFTLTGDGNNPAYAGVVTVPSEIEKGATVTDAVKVWNTATGEAITDGITLSSSNIDVATVSDTSVTAIAAGDTTITATCSSLEVGNIIGADVTVVPTAQEKADAAFTVSKEETKYTAPTVASFTYDGASVTAEKNEDGYYDITAPETKNGEKFLYWAKGLTTQKRIISFSNKLENYVPDESGVTYLIPVYENMLPQNAEYYNANGQLIPGAKDSDRPYMAGYGTASGWKQYGETNIWVAEYNNKTQPDNVTVTVENGTSTATLPYGEKVTCNANEAEEGTYFRWWQKDVNGAPEIVSVDKEYSFLAYEDCTVTAVYGDSAVTVTNPAKIIIDTFGDNSVMAEFIGFGSDVVEKGIMWNNKKIAMTAPGNQFTVTADKNGTFKGYAIVENGDGGYTLITDGEARISGLAE